MDVDDVIAHAVYDPVARRERYLKNRQLKNRQRATPAPKIGQGSRVVDANIPKASADHGIKANLDAAARQAASNARQVTALRGRLDDLKAHLAELLAKKKAEATKGKSSSDSSKKSTDKTAANTGPTKPKTAKQKQAAKEALKKAQTERAKQAKLEPNKPTGGPSGTLDEQITQARAVITDVETKLRAAIDSARTQTASKRP